MEKLSRAIIKFRKIIIGIFVLLTVFLGYQIKDIKINSDVISSLPDDDPDASLLKQVGENFGGNKIGMVILETGNVFTTEVLQHVRMITDTLKEMDGISSVTSLTNIVDIKNGDDGLEVGKLVDEYSLPETPEDLAALKEKALSKEMYRGAIVSADGTATIIIFTLIDQANVEDVARQVIEKTKSFDLPEKIYYAGAPMMVTAISDLISADLIKLIPISFLVIALVLFLGFRSKRGVFLPLLTSGIAVVWTIGAMALGGYEMTMISNNIPILLLAIGSAYTIHVLNRIAQAKEKDIKEVLITAMTHIFIPVVLAAVTTMIGFISFIFGSYLTMIMDFGIFTALGTFFSLVLSLIFVPAVVSLMPLAKSNSDNTDLKTRRSYLSDYFLEPLKNLLFRHPKYTLTAWGVLILAGLIGTLFIKRNVNIQDYFKDGNPARVGDQIMEQKFGGSKPIFILFKGDMQSPEVLKTMSRAEEYMKKSPDIMTTQSIADLIAQISDGLGEGNGIPDDQDKIEQMWFLIDGNEMLDRLVSQDLSEGVIISKFISPENKAKKQFHEYMQKFIDENSTEECQISMTGMPFIDLTMNDSLIKSQIGSLTIAIIFAVIIVGWILRSLMKGIYATIPIIASIIILFGVMGFSGIPLNIATVLVASVVLGIGIDYSIHVISNFNYWIKNGEDINHALEDTIMISGKAIVINVVSVTAGFLVLLFSEMVPLQYFGFLIGLSMISSSLAALTLLPVILILINRRHKF
jgi:predicted RND superfamily exporter protein